MRSEGTVVGLSVCLSVLYLAGRAFIRSTNDATYLAGNEVEKFCAILSATAESTVDTLCWFGKLGKNQN